MDQKVPAQERTASDLKEVGKQPRSEVVTVVMRQQDFLALKEMGGPRPDQIHMALNHYLDTMSKSGWRPLPNRQSRFFENVTSYKCPLLKSMCDDIRGLKGRFDDHTIQAIQLFLR